MIHQARVASLALRVMIYFARNDEEELTTGDIATKFDVPINQVPMSLRDHVRSGIFGLDHGTTRRQGVYRAGPRLLAMFCPSPRAGRAERVLPAAPAALRSLDCAYMDQ